MNRSFIALTSLLVLLTSFQAFSFQNIDELLADPDITWVGEVYVDYIPNSLITEPADPKIENRYGSADYNSFELLKVQSKADDDWLKELPTQLSYRLLQLNSTNLNVYKDADLTQKLSLKAYEKAKKHQVIDTIITFDPATFEEIVMVVALDLEISAVEIFRVKQFLTYNEKTNKLTVIPLAIAPIASVYNKNGIRKDILFWMPIKEAFNSLNLDALSIDWAKRLTKDIPCKSIETIKGTDNMTSIFDKMIAYYKEHSSTSKIYYGGDQELTAWEAAGIEHMGTSVDTIITFHPETFEEIVQVMRSDIRPQFAVKLRLIQDWVWDNKTQEMKIKVLGFGPIPEKTSFTLSYFPAFYIKARE
jgi:hypothetical protein